MLRTLLAPPPAESDPSVRAAFLAARDVCRRHARSFYFASHFLPIEKRYAAYAVYAFCRLLDDAVDNAEGPPEDGQAERALKRFESTLAAVYAEPPAFPAEPTESALALYAFGLTVRRYHIPQRPFAELAAGCRMDLTVSRYDTWADLEMYCYRVAGVVGLVMCPIFGLSNPAAERQAVMMGNAMQLTNILRDVGEDWGRGRLYLPREDLDRFGYTEADVANRVVDARLRALMKFEIARARDLYRKGAEGLCHLANDGSRFTAAAMATIYAGILGAIERQDYDVYRSRAHLTTWQKLTRLPAAAAVARREAGEPVPTAFAR